MRGSASVDFVSLAARGNHMDSNSVVVGQGGGKAAKPTAPKAGLSPECEPRRKRFRPARKSLEGRGSVPAVSDTATFKKPIPRYLTIKMQEEGKTFKEVSPFFIARSLRSIVGKSVENVKKLADGSLLITAARQDSLTLLDCKSFGDIPVVVEPHKVLNTSKGVIFCFDLAFVSEEECKQEMASQGVVDCRKILTRGRTKSISMILTFDSDKLPDKVNVGYHSCNVRPFIPNPLRCYNCQRFGHPSARCGKPAVCNQCGQDKHDEGVACPNSPYCVNCQGAHSSSSRDCPVAHEEKKIMEIKTEHKLSYFEAKQKYKTLAAPVFARSYAAVSSVKKCNSSTQTCGQDFAKSIRSFQTETISTGTTSVLQDLMEVEAVVATAVRDEVTEETVPNVVSSEGGPQSPEPSPLSQEKSLDIHSATLSLSDPSEVAKSKTPPSSICQEADRSQPSPSRLTQEGGNRNKDGVNWIRVGSQTPVKDKSVGISGPSKAATSSVKLRRDGGGGPKHTKHK